MPVRKSGARRRRRELSHDQEVELLFGPYGPEGSAAGSDFASDDERREAWLAHRDAFRAEYGADEAGFRKLWGFRRYEEEEHHARP